ncbi:hypothetical protein K432DRAFT_256965, partial [Lepidopterella palustris CBS 459.81]
ATAEVNMLVTMYTTYLAMHYFRQNPASLPEKTKGTIIASSSGADFYGAPPIPIYAAAKHGIVGLTRSLAPTLTAENIMMHCILPGTVTTNIVDLECMERFPKDRTPRLTILLPV